jgi:hypothetical protein
LLIPYCFHRPGPMRGNFRTCRHCRVAIDECPCVTWHRNTEKGCRLCEGSGWLGIIRSNHAMLAQMLDISPDGSYHKGNVV